MTEVKLKIYCVVFEHEQVSSYFKDIADANAELLKWQTDEDASPMERSMYDIREVEVY